MTWLDWPKDRLTERQRRLFDFVKTEVDAGRPFPSVRAIAKYLGCHRSTGEDHLRRLEAKGLVKLERLEVQTNWYRVPGNRKIVRRWSLPEQADA